MTLVARRSAPHALLRTGSGVLTLLIAACSGGDKKTDSTSTAASAAGTTATASMDSASAAKGNGAMGGPMGQMANMTGDADHDFLRMMSDHHKGMIAMAHMTKERSDAGSAKAVAKKIDAAQDKELDRMTTMLEKDFKDPYAPKVMPENKAMEDKMKEMKGTAYERAFYENTIAHHQAAIKMVDDYLPKGKSAAIKQMAEKIKADQTKEIAEYQATLAQLK